MPNVFIVRQFGEVLSHVWGVFAGGRSAAEGFTQCTGVVGLVATAQSEVVDPYGHQLLRQLCDLAARTTPVVKVTRKCLLTYIIQSSSSPFLIINSRPIGIIGCW